MYKDYLMYDETVKLTFTESGHRYRVSFRNSPDDKWSEPRPTTGVTTILNFINKGALVPWAAKLAAQEYTQQIKDAKGVKLSMLKDFEDQAKNAHIKNRDSAGDWGTKVHQAIELWHKDEEFELGEEMQESFDAYKTFWKESEHEIVMNEQPIYSKLFDYAGTFDQLVKTPTGKKVLRDIKTTKVSKWAPNGAYVEMFAQLGGYAQAMKEIFDEYPDELQIVNVGKDGKIRITSNEEFGMTVGDAIHYWNSVYTAWYTNKDWEWKFKRS